MYKEIAFDPKCMTDTEYYNLVKQHFGFDKGRYISADIKPWIKEAMSCVKASELKPIKRKAVTNFLNALFYTKNSEFFLLAKDRQSIEATPWLNWCEKQNDLRRFSCVVSDPPTNDQINIDLINEGCDRWIIPASVSVNKTPENIVAILFPLIVLSQRLTLVDQYFRLSMNPVLIEIFGAIAKTSLCSLRIVTAMETQDIQGVFDREYRALNVNNIRFEWVKAPEKYFHDRYAITEVGAVRSGQGFMADVEKNAHSDKANINIIGKEEAVRTLTDLEDLLKRGSAVVELAV